MGESLDYLHWEWYEPNLASVIIVATDGWRGYASPLYGGNLPQTALDQYGDVDFLWEAWLHFDFEGDLHAIFYD